MRRLTLATLGVMVLLGGCANDSTDPPVTEGALEAASSPSEASASPAPSRTHPSEPTSEPPADEASESFYPVETLEASDSGASRLCPSDVELPQDIDPRYCGPIPEDAAHGGRAEHFLTPSGNIACSMHEGAVTCEARETVMISDFHNPEGDGECNGFWLTDTVSLLCHSEPVLAGGPGGDPTKWPELSYGSTVFVFEHVCEVDEKGVTCWNSESGHGFLLSRARYMDW